MGLETALRLRNQNKVTVIGQEKVDEKGISCWNFDITAKHVCSNKLENIAEENGKISDLLFFQRYRGKGDSWKGEIDTSLLATKNIIEKLSTNFTTNETNSIVVINSLISRFISKEQPNSYHSVKAAIIQLVKYYAIKLGPKGIRVNSILLGTVVKERNKRYFKEHIETKRILETLIPLGRLCTTSDVINMVEFLCSKKASFITGQDLVIDGGATLQWQESMVMDMIKQFKKETII